MIGFPLGLLYANAGEWLIHKYVLHGLGKNKKSFWSFHFHEHHRNAHRNGFRDPDYQRSLWGWHAQTKEAASLLGVTLLHLPLFPVAPFFTSALVLSAANYYRVHKKAHLDPAWAREHLPWHWDHHMGKDQDKNWGVSWPWFDYLLGTRVPAPGRTEALESPAEPSGR